MDSKRTPIRVIGQRSLASSFLFCSPNLVAESKEDVNGEKILKPDSSLSLSDFLDRKLHGNSALPKVVKGKPKPFSSPVVCRDDGESSDRQIGVKKELEGDKKCLIDKLVFEQFKHAGAEKGDDCDGDNAQESRKRSNPFEDDKQSILKDVIILGDDRQLRQKGERRRVTSSKKQIPLDNQSCKRRTLYNHYANGAGFWDCGMEGVDSEEVGFNEIWEGVGSTTLGALEWH
ncbi:uncharacterized protein LOC120014813 isoform X2 [Tripterygium wilfordii]|uniref:uncharacterized protein LOC120014813 isoform X2 n=1 Tax=Tripterygium wilfordii TaxID=458696 RepID=UPI0018F82259|nr:uncharacterized protein LOC120014813 isoform X2 [Tripterygium wilfordii]